MPTITSCTVIGHAYGPCELKEREGKKYCQIRLWTSYKVKGQEEKQFTSWSGFVNGPQAEWLARDCKKGSLVCVSGSVRLAKFTKQDGTESHTVEFTRVADARCLDERADRTAPATAPVAAARPSVRPITAADDVPF
jgi:single-stranded DNA-binding protein